MEEAPAQILEIRPGIGEVETSITLAASAEACQAVFVALSEQLDRKRGERLEGAEHVQELRRTAALLERFELLAGARAHAVIQLSPEELRACLLELTGYADRMDVDGFQPPELRERLQVIGRINPVLWDANAAASAPLAPTPVGD